MEAGSASWPMTGMLPRRGSMRLAAGKSLRRRLLLEPLEARQLLAIGDLLKTLDDGNPGPQALAQFGKSVAIDGGYTVVGVPGADLSRLTDVGVAYLYDSNSGALLRTLNNPQPFGYGYEQFGY